MNINQADNFTVLFKHTIHTERIKYVGDAFRTYGPSILTLRQEMEGSIDRNID